MSHKIKAKKLSFLEEQQKKTEHYKQLDERYLKILLGERTKENALNQQIRELEVMLQSIRECIGFANKHPSGNLMRSQKCGWFLPYESKEALEILYEDQKNVMRDLEVLKTQRKLCIEHQQEIENKIRNLPTFEEKLKKYNETGKWIW